MDVWRMATEEGDFRNQYYRDLFRFQILLGGRTQEVRLSTWAEWDFDEMLWTVPKAHSKNGEKVFRPIPLELKSWLLKLKGDAKKSDPILGVIKTPEAVSQYTRLIWKKLKHDEKWTIHDLRRTLATGMSDLGVAPHIVEQLLGHKLGGVMQIYNRSRYLPEKAEALSIWIERVNVLAGLHENVVIMRSVNG
ncbi:hypothetical protein CGH96_23985 [Vibrio parahaemolyticus]|nr:hypothetical protein CGH96_23985 [Vibrio parahaemolyticus]